MKRFIVSIIVLFSTKILLAQPVTFIKSFGTANDESGVKVIEDFNGDLLVTGMTGGYPFLLKTDMSGNQIFFKTYLIDSVFVNDIIQVSDSGYVIVGLEGVSDFILKTNSAGDTLWTKKYHGSVYGEKLKSVIETKDHNLWVGGDLFIGGSVCCDAYYYKTDSAGNKVTPSIFTSGYGFFYDLLLAEDSTFIVSYGEVNSGPPHLNLRKCRTSTGSPVWDKNLAFYAQSWNLMKTINGEYAILGHSINPPIDNFIMKHDTAGIVQWTKYYDDGNYTKWFTEAATDCDSGFVIIQNEGDTLSDIHLVFANANGDSVTSKSFAYLLDDEANSIIRSADSGYVFTGFSTSFGNGGKDILLVRTDCSGYAVGIKDHHLKYQNQVTVFPNPSSGKFTIQSSEKIFQITITNLSGQIIYKREFTGSPSGIRSSYEIDLTHQSKGIYLVQVITDKEVYNQKILIQ